MFTTGIDLLPEFGLQPAAQIKGQWQDASGLLDRSYHC